MESKLTIEQLKNYLGTGLKCHAPSIDTDYRRDANVPVEFEMIGIVPDYLTIDCEALQTDVAIEVIKPICYRLSDLDKRIPELGFVPIERLPYGKKLSFYKPINPQFDLEITIQTEDYSQEIDFYDGFNIMSKLFQWHFWPFGDEYFEQGLVIDKLKHGS